jgi:hypothetical protein
MKALLAICMIVSATFVWAGEHPAPLPPGAGIVTGVVLEVKNVDSYTYLRLKTNEGETWAAVMKTPVSKGANVTIENVIVMKNFASKELKKTFPTILFGTLAGSGGGAPTPHGMGKEHSALPKMMSAANVSVPKASGENARTVAEVMTKANELKQKQVLVSGKVVKYNAGIMGKNWIHLRDGTGSEKDGSNDILVTTMNQVKIGDVVTVKGIVRTDKDFGAGYAYKVLIEKAALQ